MAWEPSARLPYAERKQDPTFRAFVGAWLEVALNPELMTRKGGGGAVRVGGGFYVYKVQCHLLRSL